jgi:hypothetical protein
VKATLPVGAYVLVRDPGMTDNGRQVIEPREFYAVVRGYDMGHTKYQIGKRLPGWGHWLFPQGGDWTFPAWCTEVTEEEANHIPERPA